MTATPTQNSSSLPQWGSQFSDHMVTCRYQPDTGWGPLDVVDFGPLPLLPSTSVFHYGQSIFEGLKAYYQPDNSVALFRPDQNARRFAKSARRLAMAELPEELFLESLTLLVTRDRDQVPSGAGESLYLRPLEFATDPRLMTQPSQTYLYVLMASPVRDYFPNGVKPVRVWLSTDYARAMPGGTGAAKFGGNYAAAMLAQRQGAEQGCDQVVWLDSTEHRYVEEMGGMNIFFVYEGERLVTPKLTGTLLEGVTRDSILTLAEDLGLKAEEGMISVDTWRSGVANGTLTEVFACGTAAVVTPVGEMVTARGSLTIGDGQTGPVTKKIREALLALHEGRSPDPHGWMVRVVG